MFEFRVGWAALSNASFRGASDWEPWEGYEETLEEVEFALYDGHNVSSIALDLVYQYSGFEWWAEVREVSDGRS